MKPHVLLLTGALVACGGSARPRPTTPAAADSEGDTLVESMVALAARAHGLDDVLALGDATLTLSDGSRRAYLLYAYSTLAEWRAARAADGTLEEIEATVAARRWECVGQHLERLEQLQARVAQLRERGDPEAIAEAEALEEDPMGGLEQIVSEHDAWGCDEWRGYFPHTAREPCEHDGVVLQAFDAPTGSAPRLLESMRRVLETCAVDGEATTLTAADVDGDGATEVVMEVLLLGWESTDYPGPGVVNPEWMHVAVLRSDLAPQLLWHGHLEHTDEVQFGFAYRISLGPDRQLTVETTHYPGHCDCEHPEPDWGPPHPAWSTRRVAGCGTGLPSYMSEEDVAELELDECVWDEPEEDATFAWEAAADRWQGWEEPED